MSHCWRKQLEIHRELPASGTCRGSSCWLRPWVTLGKDGAEPPLPSCLLRDALGCLPLAQRIWGVPSPGCVTQAITLRFPPPFCSAVSTKPAGEEMESGARRTARRGHSLAQTFPAEIADSVWLHAAPSVSRARAPSCKVTLEGRSWTRLRGVIASSISGPFCISLRWDQAWRIQALSRLGVCLTFLWTWFR